MTATRRSLLTDQGYIIRETLHTSKQSIVYRGSTPSQQHPNNSVIIKVPAEEFPSSQTRQRIIREYEIGKLFNDEHIIKYHSLDKYQQHSLALVMEDFMAVSLSKIISATNGGVSLNEFFEIAIQLADAIAVVHQQGIIHGSISSYNVIMNKENGQVKLIDFSTASQLSKELQTSIKQQHYGSALSFISPEQTGRLNTFVDARTDLYSFGIVLYHLLCGSVPMSYTGNNTIEVVYWHVAQVPVPPHQIRTEIPKKISEIVLRLLAKSPDDRYQSVFGAKYDLKICYEQYKRTGSIDEEFQIMKCDASGTFRIHQKLYGREREIASLLQIFDDISQGTTKSSIITVAGYSGIGKTSK
jgi:serine/threonine protein kinase